MPTSTITKDFEFRIDAIKTWEPQVHALVDWNEQSARKRFSRSGTGNLSGWSLGVKDIVDVEGLPTRLNANFIPFHVASQDAAIVKALESQGAFVLSKTVTTTFAFFDPGPTRNPWNLDHTPGGSSSGSAAAVACGMVRLGLGSQTVASINRPASYCGVVGFKPSYDLLPIKGVFPFAPSVDTLGFFTQTVRDMLFTFQSLIGIGNSISNAEARVGLLHDLWVEPADIEMLSALEKADLELRTGNIQTFPVQLPSRCQEAFENHWKLVAAEAAVSHRKLFQEFGQWYPPKMKHLIQKGQRIEETELERIQTHRMDLRKEITHLFDGCDVLLCPSAPGAAPAGIESTGDPRFSLLWTYTGLPTLTLPFCLSQIGLPLSVQLVAPMGRDIDLLWIAKQMESQFCFSERHQLIAR